MNKVSIEKIIDFVLTDSDGMIDADDHDLLAAWRAMRHGRRPEDFEAAAIVACLLEARIIADGTAEFRGDSTLLDHHLNQAEDSLKCFAHELLDVAAHIRDRVENPVDDNEEDAA